MIEALKIVLSLSLSGSLLILILFLLRPLFKDRFSKCWQYYIWLVVVVRLLLPFAPKTNLMGTLFQEIDKKIEKIETVLPSVQGAISIPEVNIYQSRDSENEQNNLENEQLESTASAIPLVQKILSVILENLWLTWLVVALILLIRKITIYQSFVQYIRAGCAETADIDLLERFGKLAEQNKVKTMVELYTNNLISSPLLIGFFRPCIVLPSANLPSADFEYTILHELTHYKRLDMFYKWLIQFTVCIHWFNPLVNLMGREISRACELSCDEAVIRALAPHEQRAYGDTLLNAVKSGGNYKNSLASVTLNESKELLKERLDAIMKFKKQSKMKTLLSAVLTLAICFGGAFTGAYAAAPNQIQGNGQDAVTEGAEDIVLNLASNGQNSITQSSSFKAEDNQILTLTIQSDIKGGFVDFFLFSPDYKEQHIVIGSSDETKTIPLSAGTWAYNCTGFFESGNVAMIGTISPMIRIPKVPTKTEVGTEDSEVAVLNLKNGGQNSITQSGSFEANDNQTLILTIQSDIKGGSVDFFLFSPDYKEQRITISGSDETKTIPLSAGTWAYHCTGFFESGEIAIVGKIKND